MIYHYTKQLHLPSILKKGLLPTDLFIAKGERPVNWFTTNPLWERTVFILTAPTLPEAHEYMRDCGGLVRIICDDDVAPYRWKELKEIAAIPYYMSRHLYCSAIKVGARPGEWRGTLDVVPVEKFLAIEFFDGQVWSATSYQEKMAA
jgi:hypothetical protein